ncbi:MAG: hypothetical protein ABIK99_05050 [candidate division WOR-3 bacterium]
MVKAFLIKTLSFAPIIAVLFSCKKKTEDVFVSKNINKEEGGEVETPQGEVKVTIPPNALSENATLTIRKEKNPPPGENKEYLSSVGDCYAISLSNGTVVDTIEVSFSYENLNLPTDIEIADLFPAYYDSTKGYWVRLGSDIDTGAKEDFGQDYSPLTVAT